MKRGKFSLSFTQLLSCNMGQLIPCGLVEVIPGDTFQQATSVLLRASPLLAPVMHPIDVRIHHWFVPHRLVWEDFEDFITGGSDGMDASVFPTKSSTVGVGSAVNHLGCPINAAVYEYSALPIRGYQLIYNEWYRDQDLSTAATVDIGSGPDTTTSVSLRNINWEKDYFTSSRPWEQKGPAITIPLGTTAPVLGIGVQDAAPNANPTGNIKRSGGIGEGTFTNAWEQTAAVTSGVDLYVQADIAGTGASPNVRTDLSTASAITVTRLREALGLQRYEEARARFGSRYVEYLRYYGVRSSDARLQRPEYLGGGRQTIQFSEVLQTTPTAEEPVGQLRGHGIAAMRSNRYRRYFEEHGYVFSMLSVRPKTIYMQGIPRTYNRRSKEDFFTQELQHIGQQEVLNKEVYVEHTTPDGVFGYQDRYDEYRRKESLVTGEFTNTTLNYWHLARDFSSNPALNHTFVQCVPTERVFAVPSEDVLWVQAKHSIQARRPLIAQTGRSFIF